MRRLLAALAAPILAFIFMLTGPVSPAQAAWSGQSCANDSWNDPNVDARVCMQTYTEAASGGGYLLTRVYVCAYHIAGGGSKFQGLKNGGVQEYTSNGTPNGYLQLPDIPVGSCVNVATGAYKGGPFSSGNGASVIYRGTANYAQLSDRQVGISMPCCGGGG